jgi:DNA-binding beta-propeller fold protein YncE
MSRAQTKFILCLIFFASCCLSRAQVKTNTFVNFETAPLHALAISPDGATLAACNLPDNRVEIFDLTVNPPAHKTSVFVGLDPVTVRFRNSNELWVANHISASINVIDIEKGQVTRSIDLPDGPADIVFAGDPQRAFISCPAANLVIVYDPANNQIVKQLAIGAERPKAMGVSPDGSKVFVAIFESGNGTTILAPRFTSLTHFAPAGPADLPIGPYAGQNPPPNSGTNLFPAIGTNLPPTAVAPRVSLIVKRQNNGHWLDDNNGDWTEFVSGDQAALSGRVPGWDLPDHDVAIINTADLSISYINRLMNICMDLAVNPKTGQIAIVGSEALNHVRFEPVLQSIFTRVELALISPDTASTAILDLNPHLDYKVRSIPELPRARTIGDPRGAVWNSTGERLYVTGMGSDNLLVLDASGNRIADPIAITGGPLAMALDEARHKLYVLCRFGASIAIVNTETLKLETNLRFFDPTPTRIRLGRNHFYNTHKSSGLGQAACASCHLDGRTDRLAWDLGSQLGKIKKIVSPDFNFANTVPEQTNDFHPMKGPMTTQTLQDIIGHEPFHWRGDRLGIEEFNPTFEDLQGADDQLTDPEMQEFEDFLASIFFPPNRLRNFDNSLPQKVQLPGQKSLGRGRLNKGDPLPNGNANAGLNFFVSKTGGGCTACHSLPSGHGPDRVFKNGSWKPLTVGTNGQHHVSLVQIERSGLLPFKIPHLRSLAQKTGLDFSSDQSRSGFGFTHDGRLDSLVRFLQDGFDLTDDQQTADTIAFLFAFSGSDLKGALPNSTDKNNVPGDFSRDVPASTGKQLLVAGTSGNFDLFVGRAISSTGRLELIVKGSVSNEFRGWWFSRSLNGFQSDRKSEQASKIQLLDLASKNGPFLAMLVPEGTGKRIALDRDDDGFFDSDEVDAGADPANPNSYPGKVEFQISLVKSSADSLTLAWPALIGQQFSVEGSPALVTAAWSVFGDQITANSNSVTVALPLQPIGARYFRVKLLPNP